MRHGREQSIFKRTQHHLTIGFIGQLMLFLFLFIIVMFIVLYIVIIHEQEREIQSLASKEAFMVEKKLRKDNLRPEGNHEREYILPGFEQFFYYVVSPDGELLFKEENYPQLRTQLLSLLLDERTTEKKIFQEKLNIDVSDIENNWTNEYGNQLALSQKNIHLIIAKEKISIRNQEIGTLYIGKDISFVYHLFKWLLLILLGLMFVFFGVALFISYRMSKKAMIPINAAFDRQRQFVADASHELRTPLSVLLSSIDAIEMTIDVKKDNMVQKLLFNMKDEVKRMTRLVSDLLTLARSDSGKIERNNDVFDFIPVAKKAIDSVKLLATEKQINLQFKGPESIIGQGDKERLTQLLYILLDNAIKYTQSGGDVDLSLSIKHHELCIEVRDTGIGIQPEEQQLIFERFYRSDKGRSRQMGSYGLGLSIAKWIVDIHNGSVQLESKIAKGSTFIIRIPFYIKNPEKV